MHAGENAAQGSSARTKDDEVPRCRDMVSGGEGGMSAVQSNPSLQWCLSGASELPLRTCHHHSQQQHTRPSASVTVARIIWWPLTGVEIAAVLSLDT